VLIGQEVIRNGIAGPESQLRLGADRVRSHSHAARARFRAVHNKKEIQCP